MANHENKELAIITDEVANCLKNIQDELNPMRQMFESMFRNDETIRAIIEFSIQQQEIENRLREALLPVIEANIALNSFIHSDECFRGLSEMFKQQEQYAGRLVMPEQARIRRKSSRRTSKNHTALSR